MRYPISINFIILDQYDLTKLKIDQVVFFEWLVVKKLCFGNPKFYYQQKRVMKELGMRRARFEKIRKEFMNIGLKVALEGPNNITHYHVHEDFIENFIHYYVKEQFQNGLLKKILQLDFRSKKTVSGYEREEISLLIEDLNTVFNERRRINSNKDKKYTKTTLPVNNKTYNNLYRLSNSYSAEFICNGFTAFCDSIIRGQDSSKHMLNNFSSFKSNLNSFPVFERYLTMFNEQYYISSD